VLHLQQWSPHEFKPDKKNVTYPYVLTHIGVPLGVSEEKWVKERMVECDDNRELAKADAELELTRFFEMAANICGATFSQYPGSPAKPVVGHKSLRRCWFYDGSGDNCEKMAWLLYYAPTSGHERFRKSTNWAAWKEEIFMRNNNLEYEVLPGREMPRVKCVATMFSRHLNSTRNNILASCLNGPHDMRLQLENPAASAKEKGGVENGAPRKKKIRWTRKNPCTFYLKDGTTDIWTQVCFQWGVVISKMYMYADPTAYLFTF
jgi:hypothetical protein